MFTQRVSGTVYGVILNDHASVRAIGDLEAAPYKGAPKAPALYIKPANTHCAEDSVVTLPDGETTVEVGATVGLVMARAASRLSEEEALGAVGGLVLAADLSLPHASYYRPAIREKCFDGALPLGPVVPFADVSQLSQLSGLSLKVDIDGIAAGSFELAELVRSPAKLLADVTAFMTLRQGDVLLVGVRYQAPRAEAGSRVKVLAAGLGELSFTIGAAKGERQ